MQKASAILIALVILSVLAYPKVRPLLESGSGPAATADGESPANLLKVDGFIVKPDLVRNIVRTTGSVRANEEVDLRSEVSGKITAIYLQEGEPVQEGALLIKINDSELRAQFQRAQYRLNLASERERRQKQLLAKGGISQEDYDATLNEVNVLKSEVALINAQIDKTEIRSPFDGVVGLRYVSEGSFISPSTRIASLQDIDSVKLDFTIPERYATRVAPGDDIQFMVQTAPRAFEGEIYAIEPNINSDTRTLSIRARSDNPDQLLLPGSFADIELILDSQDDAVTVPTIAVIPELQGQYVFLYRSGRVAKQPVQTGIRMQQKIQITGGLAHGDTVLTTGLLQVRDGMPVQLANVE